MQRSRLGRSLQQHCIHFIHTPLPRSSPLLLYVYDSHELLSHVSSTELVGVYGGSYPTTQAMAHFSCAAAVTDCACSALQRRLARRVSAS